MKLKHSFTWLGMTGYLFPLSFMAAAEQSDIAILDRSAKAFSSVVKKAGPAVVYIGVEKPLKDSAGSNSWKRCSMILFLSISSAKIFPWNPNYLSDMEPAQALLSSKDGLILTNNHVVEDA